MAMPFSPNPDDGAIALLRMIFGKVMDGVVAGNAATASSASANMLAEAFRFFNSGVLLFGSVILLWVTVFGITNTANDGEALGKKWSTFYTPLRTLVSAGALIPTASGYAGVQIVILLIVSYSIGFASNLWGSVVKFAVGQDVVEQAVMSISDDPNFESLALDALRMQICAAGVNKAMNATTFATAVNLQFQKDEPREPSTSLNFNLGSTKTYTTTLYYKDAKWPSSEDICGKIVVTTTFTAPATTSKAATQVANSLNAAITQVRYRYATKLFAPDSPTASIAMWIVNVAGGQEGVIDSKLVADAVIMLKRNYMADVTAEVKKIVEKDNANVVDKLTERGWIYAGSLYTELARIKDAIRMASTSRSEFIQGSGNFDQMLSGDVAKAANGILATYNTISGKVTQKAQTLQNAAESTQPKLPAIKTSFDASDFSDGGNSIKTSITSWFNGLSTYFLQGTVHYMSEPNQDPIMRVKNIGDFMSTFALTVIVAETKISASVLAIKTAAEAGSNQPIVGVLSAAVAGFSQFAATLLAKTWAFVSTAVYTILYTGYFLGIWIPMIPFYIFALGVVGWLIFIGEMLAAGVLWMAAHTTPAREDSFIGSQAQGYLLIMSGFFRPALMVLGLVFSISVLNPAVMYLNEGFIVAVRSLQADSVTGLFSLAGFMLGYSFLIFSVFMMVFTLPQTFPDRILKWIGAGIGDLGENQTASRLENAAGGQARAAAMKGAAASAAKKQQDLKDNEKSENEAKETLRKASGPEGHSGQSTAIGPMSAAASEAQGAPTEGLSGQSSASNSAPSNPGGGPSNLSAD